MYYTFMTVDRAFRNLMNATRRGHLTPEAFKSLFWAWESILDDYLEFINQLPDQYMTPYIEKTLDKKKDICMKLLRTEGIRYPVQMRSGLSEKLFQAAQSTELVFKILGEYVITCDITIDKFSQGCVAFLERKDKLQENINRLEALRNQVARKKTKKKRRRKNA